VAKHLKTEAELLALLSTNEKPPGVHPPGRLSSRPVGLSGGQGVVSIPF
jgi:hypothetical protein